MHRKFQSPNLRAGQMHRGPDYYRSTSSGHAPVIYRTTDGHKSYIVCHHGDLHEAIQRNREKQEPKATVMSTTGRRMYFYSLRDAAESRFAAMCQAQVEINRQLHEHQTTNARLRTPRRVAVAV